jgi:hypothetical protein
MVDDELRQIFDVIIGLTLYLPLLVAAAQRSARVTTSNLLLTTTLGRPSMASAARCRQCGCYR